MSTCRANDCSAEAVTAWPWGAGTFDGRNIPVCRPHLEQLSMPGVRYHLSSLNDDGRLVITPRG